MGDASRDKASIATRITNESEDQIVEVSPTKDAHTLDRANSNADSGTISITNTAIPARVGVSNLTNRKTILIQPLDGICFVGFSPSSQPHRIARRDLVEFKVGPDLDLYIRKNGAGPQDVAITELA